eukprot:4816652-Pyramimonas_sp.AAC.2
MAKLEQMTMKMEGMSSQMSHLLTRDNLKQELIAFHAAIRQETKVEISGALDPLKDEMNTFRERLQAVEA